MITWRAETMAEALTVLNTNTTPDSVQDIPLGCPELWSIGQQEAIRRLSRQRTCFFTGSQRWELIADFSARAARIAATYARFYLETERGCNPDLKGRFYWMGLAAFASKQVKCGLDFIGYSSLFPHGAAATHVSKNSLGKGNFWLFQDIFVWHWFYVHFPEQFDDCAPQRDASASAERICNHLSELPWASEALPKLNNLKLTPEIVEAFEQVRRFENSSDMNLRREAQLESLLAIANHEQKKILQPLIYESWAFRKSLDFQALVEDLPMIPKRVAAFSTLCDIENTELRVEMDKSGDLYEIADRMSFINDVAGQFHRLMESRKDYMESTIAELAKTGDSL